MLLTERQLKLLRDTRLLIDELIAAHYVARPLDNGSGGTSLETPRPAGEKIQPSAPAKSGIECVTITDKSGVIAMNGGDAANRRKCEPKEHVFNTQLEAVLYASNRRATTDRPFRAVSCGDQWTVEEVTEANK